MSPTVNHVRSTRNAEQLGFCAHVATVQGPGTLNGTPLNGETIASYDIDPGDTIKAVVCALLLVPLSISCVVIIGALRACGAR